MAAAPGPLAFARRSSPRLIGGAPDRAVLRNDEDVVLDDRGEPAIAWKMPITIINTPAKNMPPTVQPLTGSGLSSVPD
jgi:hypothetical protein